MAEETPELVISIVTGLAPDDLLNIRTAASPTAKVEARLIGGDRVTNLGCNDINGYKWCKVESTGKQKLSGWAPARYLIPLNPAPYVEGETKPAEAPVVDPNSEAAAEAAGPASTQPPAPPPDLTARLGGVADQAAPQTTPESAAATAMQDAYGLALAATETPPAGEIPCARYVGQPMERCEVSVVRTADKADVTVTWPDGGTRVIAFDAGRPAGSDADGNFSFTREGSLNMIRVGVSERFEITDAIASGD